jgi:TPR repeat protein
VRQTILLVAWHLLAVPLVALFRTLIVFVLQLAIWPLTRRLPAVAPDLILGLAMAVGSELSWFVLDLAVDKRDRKRSRPNWLLRASGLAGLIAGAIPLLAVVALGRITDAVYTYPALLVSAVSCFVWWSYGMLHWSVRLLLWRSGVAPLRYIRFLDHATERILMHRVVGGYQFLHPLLRDHFAAMPGPLPAVPPTLPWLELPPERSRSTEYKVAYEHAREANEPDARRFLRRALAAKEEERGRWQKAIDAYRWAAEEGDVEAGRRLGELAERDGRVDIAEGCYRAAAETGDSWAMYHLGRLAKADGNVDKAMDWYCRGLAMGDQATIEVLERAFRSLLAGMGSVGIAMLQKEADAGHAWAMILLGSVAEAHFATSEAEGWYRRAADAGDHRGMCQLGWMMLEWGNINDAEAWFRQAAEEGNRQALVGLGMVAQFGRQNLVDAGLWYREAADAGDSAGAFLLARLSQVSGLGREMLGWYRRAAAMGDHWARSELWQLGFDTKGSPRD